MTSTGIQGVSIRRAELQDAGLVLDFIRQLARYEKLEHEVVATEQSLRDTLFGERPAAEVVIALDRGEPAGFALFFQNYSTFLGQPGIHLEDLYVSEERRGRGIGRALLAYLAAETRARGGGRLEWAVLDWNAPAIGFYEKLGAKAMDEWTTFRLTGEALDALARASRANARVPECQDAKMPE